ncbi:glycolate oxidase subunit GlcE [Variovorax sp. PAMC 28711]|uniref:glycolate oxidase subunit GlcE n=1 Tax=Variovorax sp. PAMC 28711 TaxID=1795631 RepID=UPI00078D0406|nr:glycolate oxidase subunit GlcE [Variovorax sp. PAMC 28711]AMM24560.1 glycolate oxidase [Variovorax sp. PAMC 28711]
MDPALRQIADRIRAAATDATPLDIRGGGTKYFYGEAPQGEPLVTSELHGITSYEPSELVVTVRAGTPLAELEALLAEHGQCLPFEAPRFAHPANPGVRGGTVGGMVAAGLSGPSRASVGAVRDYVLGATLVNGRGEVLSFGGTVMKNVAGYDVSRVLAGSLGVLGLIAEVSLKVLPVAPAEATLSFDCSQADALRLLNEWGGRPLPLNASAWHEADGVGRLALRLRGAVAAVEAACGHLGGERQDAQQAAAFWQSLRDQQHPWFAARLVDDGAADLWRLSVPQTAPVLALDGMPLIEWHGGQRWYCAARGQAEALRDAARAAGGSATLFAAASPDSLGAATDSVPKFDALSPPLARIHRALKHEFDPHRIFNRGRFYRDL